MKKSCLIPFYTACMLLPVLVYGADDRDELRKKIIITESRYSDGKKKQKQEFHKNLWKDKEHVNKWFNSDKDYLALVVEYKKKYLNWAKEQLSEGKDTDIERFIEDKKLDPEEREIVHVMQRQMLAPRKKEQPVREKKASKRLKTGERFFTKPGPGDSGTPRHGPERAAGTDVVFYRVLLGVSWAIILLLVAFVVKQRLVRSRDSQRSV